MNAALLLIDLQNDFCPGGALAVAEGDQVIAIANQAIDVCLSKKIPVIASQDWHPAEHRSFAINSNAESGTVGELNGLPQVWWPMHCVQNESGAALHPQLKQNAIENYFGVQTKIIKYKKFYKKCTASHSNVAILRSCFLLVIKHFAWFFNNKIILTLQRCYGRTPPIRKGKKGNRFTGMAQGRVEQGRRVKSGRIFS